MRKILFIFLLSVFSSALYGQDYLAAPSVNPALFKGDKSKLQASRIENRLKSSTLDDSVVYRFDTLALPFLDDFSTNHLLKPFNTNRVSYTDTTVYRLYIGNSVYRDTLGLVSDSTFTHQIGQDSTIIQRTANLAGFAQLHNISKYPTSAVTVEFYQPYNIYDTINGGADTVSVSADLFQDSANYYFVNVDSNVYYTDREVLLNNTFPILPPSIGVVTFDGLDQNGLPYDFENPRTLEADHLTSLPLYMGNLPDTNVYISFYIEPKGISINGPEAEDSLVLDFYNPSNDKWGSIWGTAGYSADTFQQVMVKVPNRFHQDGAQFRFRAYANSTGAFDQWHLDYIYLNAGRTPNDTNYRDVAYVYKPNSFLKDYHAMPYWHFQDDPAEYMFDSTGAVLARNNFNDVYTVFNKVVIPDTINNTNYYRYPAGSEVAILLAKRSFAFNYPINFDFQANEIDSAGTLKAIYDIRFNPATPAQADIIPSNDTVSSTAILDNYYAYDDGTAEAGYGINPQQTPAGFFAYMAVEFNQPFIDTIGGMQIYFLPQTTDIRSQRFRLKIWEPSQSGGPGDLIYTKEDSYNPIYTDDNGFLTLWFDSLVGVGQRYYLGIETIGQNSLNVGYDLNTDHRDRIFWSYDANTWFFPNAGIQEGSLMIRPIYRKNEWGVGLKKRSSAAVEWKVFPNPSKEWLYLDFPSSINVNQMQLIDMSGRIHWQSKDQSVRQINVHNLPNGIYILRVVDQSGITSHKKIIVSHE